MDTRYRFLRFVAFLLKLIAVLWLLGGLAVTAVLLSAGNNWAIGGFRFQIPSPANLVIALVPLLSSLLYFLLLFAAGGVVSLLLAMEENTRSTATRVNNLSAASRVEPPATA